ncbi:MAG: AIR synthase related protein [Buchananella hordeovulneris]|nr:AIR synthase related protein [Buchananella hordeovulneris]
MAGQAPQSEDALIEGILPHLPLGSHALVGPGDDCAVVRGADVVTTDMLVEGSHFWRDVSSAYQIGARAAAQNLADVAAMGAIPTSLVCALALPAEVEAQWVNEFARGLGERCAAAGAGVVGGDITSGPVLTVSITALGSLEGRAPVLRSGARAGHVVAVSGTLGLSAAGLKVASKQRETAEWRLVREPIAGAGAGVDSGGSPNTGALGAVTGESTAAGESSLAGQYTATGGAAVKRAVRGGGNGYSAGKSASGGGTLDSAAAARALGIFCVPEPHLAAGVDAAVGGASAMMDVSDGLLRDCQRMAKASGVRIDIDQRAWAGAKDPAANPASQRLEEAAHVLTECAAWLGYLGEQVADKVQEWMLTGGEDHALLAAFPTEEAALAAGFAVIGTCHPADGPHGASVTVLGEAPGNVVQKLGWDHLSR